VTRAPEQLTPDELMSLNQLWRLYPDEVLMHHDRDHRPLDGLVEDGYVERTRYPEGMGYRLAAVHAAGLARLKAETARAASLN
jgi:hypothetical protein